MRKIWTSGFHIHQEINGEAQGIMIAVEHLGSEIPSIGGQHDIWVHSSDYEKLQEQNKKVNELIVKIFEQDRFNEDYFDLELINEVRVHIENN